MKVLVTGATGFLGGYLIDPLLRRGHTVRALVRPGRPRHNVGNRDDIELVEGDLLDPASLVRACQGVDGLIHGAVHDGYWSKQNDLQRRTNEGGTESLYNAARGANLERVVHVSTVATIGPTRDGTVLDETSPWMERHLGMRYVFDKRATEAAALRAAEQGLGVVIVNPGSMIGPRKDGSPPAWHLRRVALGKTRWAPGGGVTLVDVADVAEGIISALERGRVGERYLLTGHNLTNREFYEHVNKHVGRPRHIREIPNLVKTVCVAIAGGLDKVGLSRPPFTPEYFRLWGWYGFFDSGKAARELGYTIRPIEQTLARYDWHSETNVSAGTGLNPIGLEAVTDKDTLRKGGSVDGERG
jgi:dihydroflavonol-4-reductase